MLESAIATPSIWIKAQRNSQQGEVDATHPVCSTTRHNFERKNSGDTIHSIAIEHFFEALQIARGSLQQQGAA